MKINHGSACKVYVEINNTLAVVLDDQFCNRSIILPVILYGYETWSLMLREEHRLRVFENRVLRRVFGPKGNEVTG